MSRFTPPYDGEDKQPIVDDLVMALKTAENMITNDLHTDTLQAYRRKTQVLAKIRAAIEKAEGKQP